jgi:vesicle-associated membrane protein 7
LEDIHGRFVKTYGRAALTALAYAMNDEFSRVLSQQMDYYSNDPNADRINRMRGEINQVMHPFIFSFFFVYERPIYRRKYFLKVTSNVIWKC